MGGAQPDIILCRSPDVLEEDTRKKIANQCNIPACRIISAHNVANLFHVPSVLAKQHIVGLLNGLLRLDDLDVTPAKLLARDKTLRSLDDWNKFAQQVDKAEASEPVVIAFVGKYNKGGGDAYQSVLAALHHAAVAVSRKLEVDWIDATDLEMDANSDAETVKKVKETEARLKA